ncbi:Zinc finger, RING/FYVE/PHD-type [Akanthomyces lecanii RCEF 1005]|uniref:Zinc finger, RING/FYVE/PHD-type n=1 Tax=Akanthomyces lecanii RCEF 1005 TaxID=1081108 RepID=A0A162K122_CORDF|nr:Zinc finger, RING/FYVE/PHD-type [Akanthomyces lecanii RCEF 1005]
MSLASASPRRASLDSEIIHISTSPALPVSPRLRSSRTNSRHHHQPIQPPATAASALPPARSSSPRHHTHVSSAPLHTNTSLPPNLSNPLTPNRRPPRRRNSPSQQRRAVHHPSTATASSDFAPGSSPVATPYAVTDETFINELMREEFSSPSTYPSFRNPPPPRFDDGIYQDDTYPDSHAATTTTQTSDCMGPSNDTTAAHVPDSPSQQLQAGPSANTTQDTDFSLLETQHSPIFHDLIDDEQGATETAATSFSESMPATLGRGHSDILPPPKRQRDSQTERLLQTKQEPVIKPLAPGEDLFGELPEALAVHKDDIADEDLTTIDLTDATEVPAELRKPIIDNRIKIGAFQCAICMDDVTGLTVTYCGHLFCADCLHHSLDVESTKGKCPMCRSKIDMKPRESYTIKTKGFWPLELKLMTTTRKGKRKAEDISK